jgi:hypothetical protein
MILSLRAFPVVTTLIAVGAFSALAQGADTPWRDVAKSDGTVASYRLLPVHHVPGYARTIQGRLSAREFGAALPDTYQIPTTMLPVIRDQGQRGTCAYFATVGILETYYMASSPDYSKLTLSEECLVDVRNWEFDQGDNYTGEDKPEVRPDPNGDLPNSIIKTIFADGVPVAKKYSDTLDCSYNGYNQDGGSVALGDYLGIFSSGASQAFGKTLRFDENTAPKIDDIRALIAKNIPVEVGILVYNRYMSGLVPKSDWKYDPKQDTDDQIAGGHAIQLTGYTTKSGKTTFNFKNSWGTGWGKSGYGTIDDGLLKHSWGYDPAFDFIVSVHN